MSTVKEHLEFSVKQSPLMVNEKSNESAIQLGDITYEELKEMEAKYRLLTENSMDGIYQVDLLGRMTYINSSFNKMLGYEKGEILNKHFSFIVPTKELLRAAILFKDLMIGKSIDGLINIKRKDGTEFPVIFTATTLRKEGKIIGLTGSLKDVTEIKQKEAELEFIVDLNAKVNEGDCPSLIFDYAVQQMLKIFGLKICNIYSYEKGNDFMSIQAMSLSSRIKKKIKKISGVDLNRYKIPLYEGSGFNKVIQDGRTILSDNTVQDIKDWCDNKAIHSFVKPLAHLISYKYSLRIPLKVQDRIIGILGVSRDYIFTDEVIASLNRLGVHLSLIINKLKNDEKLQNSKKRLNEILNVTPSAIIHTRLSDGKIMYANNSLAKILKLPLRKIIGQKLPDCWVDSDQKKEYIMNTIKDQGFIKNQELKIKSKGTSELWILASMNLSVVGGEPTVFTGFTDITYQKKVEQQLLTHESSLENQVAERTRELNKALSREKELNNLKTNFVTMASHEFRTPLTTILSASDILKRYRDRMTETEVNSKIDKIQSEVKGLTDILNDFLVIGSSEAGKIDLKVEKIDLKLFLDEEITSLKDSIAKEHEIDYVFKSAEIVNLDSRIIKNIISNLLGNAIKYSATGSKIEFHISARNGSLIIQVNDQGIGISKNDLENIFTPFHRGSNVGTIQGTGLGMTIVKQSVELHGGQITINSKEGVGTEVKVTIPLDK